LTCSLEPRPSVCLTRFCSPDRPGSASWHLPNIWFKPDSAGRLPQGDPCQQCDGCRQFLAGSHADYQFLDIEDKRKALRVEQIRGLSSWLSLTASGSGGKHAVIAQAEKMSQGASNSLLKTLEEPPGDTLLILVTALPGRLSATIRSRCQQLSIPRPETAQALAWLEARESGDWAEALALAEGAPLRALALAGGEGVEQARNRAKELIAIANGRETVVSIAEKWSRQPLPELMDWWRVWLEQLARWLQAGPDHAPAMQAIGDEDLQKFRGRIDWKSLHELLDAVNQAEKRLDSANPQLLMESLLGHWAQLCGIIGPAPAMTSAR